MNSRPRPGPSAGSGVAGGEDRGEVPGPDSALSTLTSAGTKQRILAIASPPMSRRKKTTPRDSHVSAGLLCAEKVTSTSIRATTLPNARILVSRPLLSSNRPVTTSAMGIRICCPYRMSPKSPSVICRNSAGSALASVVRILALCKVVGTPDASNYLTFGIDLNVFTSFPTYIDG